MPPVPWSAVPVTTAMATTPKSAKNAVNRLPSHAGFELVVGRRVRPQVEPDDGADADDGEGGAPARTQLERTLQIRAHSARPIGRAR